MTLLDSLVTMVNDDTEGSIDVGVIHFCDAAIFSGVLLYLYLYIYIYAFHICKHNRNVTKIYSYIYIYIVSYISKLKM